MMSFTKLPLHIQLKEKLATNPDHFAEMVRLFEEIGVMKEDENGNAFMNREEIATWMMQFFDVNGKEYMDYKTSELRSNSSYAGQRMLTTIERMKWEETEEDIKDHWNGDRNVDDLRMK